MIIGIDGNEANIEKRVGVNEYAFQIIKNLQKLSGIEENDLKLIVYLQKSPVGDMPDESPNFKYKVIPGRGLWILTKLMPYLFFTKEKPEIIFTPSHYVPPFATMPRVCSIMDLGYLKFSGQFKKFDFWQLKVWSAISISVSKAIIAISNSTKEDIVRHYPTSKGKIYVTPLAYDNSRFNDAVPQIDVRHIKNKYSIVSDYVVYMGTLKPSKNIEGLIEAFSHLSDFPDLKLVIAGKKGWMYESIFAKVKNLELEDRVIFTDFVPEEDKPALIAGAKVFVLSSFWEGFGLDVLNAMACGVPVVVSDAGSLPEVAGEAGVYVDPKNPESIAEGLRKVLTATKSQYNSMRQKGIEQARKFSWEKTAAQTLEILKNVYRQNRQKIIG